MTIQSMVTTAHILSSAVRIDGMRAMLVLVRTFWQSEGTCVVELADSAKSDHIAYGTWRIEHPDQGPSVLVLEWVDFDEPELETALTQELFNNGQAARWGIESV